MRGFEWDYVNGLCHAELMQFDGMANIPSNVAVTIDGVHVVAALPGNAPKLYVWEIDQAQPIEIRDQAVLAIADDGSKAAVVDLSDLSLVRIVEPVTGEVLHEFRGVPGMSSFADLGGPDNSLLACMTNDNHYRVWDTTTGEDVFKYHFPFRNGLSPIAISNDGKRLAWRRPSGAAERYELASKRSIWQSPVDPKLLNAKSPVDFSPDGQLFAVGNYGHIEIRSASDGSLIGRLNRVQGFALSVKFSPDGKLIAVTGEDASIRVYDAKSLGMVTRLTGHGIGVVYGISSVAFDQSGDRLISGGADKSVKLWDLWSGDQHSLTRSGVIADENRLPSQAFDYLTEMADSVGDAKVTDDGSMILAACRDRAVRVFDASDGKLLRTWWDLDHGQAAVDFHPGSGLVVAGGGGLRYRDPGKVTAWDFKTGQQLWQVDHAHGPVRNVEIFDSGKRVAVAVGNQSVTRGELFVLDSKTGELIWKSREVTNVVLGMSVSPDGESIATVGNRPGIEISDAKTGAFVKRFDDSNYFSVDFSSDAKSLAVGAIDWSVRIYDVESTDLVWSSRLHGGAVTDVQFVAEDSRVVSTSLDGSTRIWDSKFGDLLLTLEDDGEEKYAVAASPSGELIASAGQNPVVLLRQTRKLDQLDTSRSWVPVFEDDFERDDLGDRWKVQEGEWSIKDGQLIGTHKPLSSYPQITAATVVPDIPMPSRWEIEYDAQIDQPMILGVGAGDLGEVHGIAAYFLGMTNTPFRWNRGEKGVSIIASSKGALREAASRRDGEFGFDSGRTYRFRIRRTGPLLETWIDNQPYRSARVPMTMPLGILSLQSLFGEQGSGLMVDNVVIKVPDGSELEMAAIQMVSDLFQREFIKPLVIGELEHMRAADVTQWMSEGFSSEDLVAEAFDVTERWYQDLDTVVEKSIQLATSNEMTKRKYGDIYHWLNDNTPIKNEAIHRAMLLTAFRAGDNGSGWNSWHQSSRAFYSNNGYYHPLDTAVTALMQYRNNNTEDAHHRTRQLQTLMLSDQWKDNEQARAWAKEVNDTTELPETPPLRTRLMERVWEEAHARMIGCDLRPLESMLADDAKLERKVIGGADPNAITIEREAWLDVERLWCQGSRTGVKLVRDQVSTVREDTFAVVNNHFVYEIPGMIQGWRQYDTFVKRDATSPDEWMMAKRVIMPDWLKYNGTVYDDQKDRWQSLVQAAENESNLLRRARLLGFAGRIQESLDAAAESAREQKGADDFALLAYAAWQAGRPDLMRKATDKVIELDPRNSLWPYLRVEATRKMTPSDPVAIGKNVWCRPPSFYEDVPTRITGEKNNTLAAWQVANESLISIFVSPLEQGGIGQKVADMLEARKNALKAEIIENGELTVDGFPARQFVVGGAGIGRALGGGGPTTLQRFVLVERDDDIVVLLVSAFATQFANRDSEFKEFLKTVRLRDVNEMRQPAPQSGTAETTEGKDES